MVQKKKKTERYEEAVRLRKRGFTYREIAHMVGASKSTISGWFSHETWSQEVTKRNSDRATKENGKRVSLLNKARSNQLMKMYANVRRTAEIEYRHYKKDPLFIAGLSVYLTQGDAESAQNIRFSSSRQPSHRIVIDFACTYLGVPREKIRTWLLLYPAHDPLMCTRSWSSALNIPVHQFGTYHIVPGKNTTKRLRFGVGNTIIGGAVLKYTLNVWIEILQQDLKS